MTKMLLFSTLLFIMLAVSVHKVNGQCGNELLKTCIENNNNVLFLRSFPVQLGQQINGATLPVRKYNMVLTSGNKYRILTCNANEFKGKAIVSLHYEEELMGSSFCVDNHEHLPYLSFECKQSGMYSISFYFEGGEQGCAVGIITTE